MSKFDPKEADNDDDFFIFDATNIDNIFKYLKAIDWRERWLQGLIAFHIISFILIILTRKRFYFQMSLFFSLLGLCFFAEKLNELGANNWRLFAKEQYFDSNGLFIAVVFCGPLIVNTLVIVILWLIETTYLLKSTAELKGKHIKRQREMAEKKKAT